MNPTTEKILRAARQAVSRLVQECRRTGPLYARSPRAVAQVSRTGKWLLNALTSLDRELDTSPSAEEPRAG